MNPLTTITLQPESQIEKLQRSIHYYECENEVLLSQIFLNEKDEAQYRSNCEKIQSLRNQLTATSTNAKGLYKNV